MPKQKVIRIVIAALAALLLLFGGCKLWQKIRGEQLVIYGNVDIRTVNLSFRVPGKLLALDVDEGDAIEPGQILGRLDPEPLQNALLEAEGAYLAQKAQAELLEEGYRSEEIAQVRAAMRERQVAYEYADINARRLQQLYSSGAISADERDNARTARNEALAALQAAKDKLAQYETGSRTQEIEAAQAELKRAEAALAQARLNLDDTVLKSPSAGTILTRAVEPGSMLAAGSSVFTLSLTRPVWVRAYVDETNLSLAVPGAKVEVYSDGRPEQPYTGSIGFVSPTAEFTPKTVQTPELRTDLVYRLRIIVENPDDGLRQGMPVTVKFP